MIVSRLISFVTATTLSMVILSGCTNNVEPTAKLTFTPETYPVVDGSTVTIPLSEMLGSRLMDLPIEEARQYIVHNKTHDAYVNLIKEYADIIFVTSPSEEELALAESNDIEFEVIPIVSEAFVFLTGKDNIITGLSLEEIQKIYTGEITSWNEVGGEDMEIIPYQRPVNSGSQTGFLDLVMGELEPMNPPTNQIVAGMGELIDTVSAYTDAPDGLGYSYYYYTSEMWGNDRVKLIEIDGTLPDPSTIASGAYPLRTAYYAVIRADEAENSPVRQMVSFLLSEEGQSLVEEAGYVRIKPKKE
jgi:phosphate transport system substrate-binding protein